MILYEVWSGEDTRYYASKRLAISAAKEMREPDANGEIKEFSTVDEVELPKLSKELLLAALNQQGFIVARRQIWPKKD